MIIKFREEARLIDLGLTTDDKTILDLADALLMEYNVTKHLKRKKQILISIIVNLKLNDAIGLKTAIPRGENFYSNITKRYKLETMSHDIVVGLIDRLKLGNKYVVEYSKGVKYDFTEASMYHLSPRLRSLTKSFSKDDVSFEEEESIILRKRISAKTALLDSNITSAGSTEISIEESLNLSLDDEYNITKKLKKIIVDYTDTDYTNSIRSDLNEYNQLRSQSSISLKDLPEELFKNDERDESIRSFAAIDISEIKPDENGLYQIPLLKDQLCRIFTEDFDHGGRFYRGFETRLRKELRPYIAINGASTIELDYSSYHIRMLYHLHKKRCPEDPYMVEDGLLDYERDYYKIMVAACLNNSSEKSVLNTLRYHIIKKGLKDKFSSLDDVTLKVGLDKLIQHNRKVSEHFFKGDGLKFHKMDADIANDILMHFTRRKSPVLVLCVHDSFIIAGQYEEELIWAMNKFYRYKLHKLPKIK